MKRVATFLSTAALVFMVGGPVLTAFDAEARGYSSRSSFSRSSFRSSPKVSRSTKTARAPKTKGGFWGNKSKGSGKSKSIKTKHTTKVTQRSGGVKSIRTKQALKISRNEKKFKKQSAPIPGMKKTTGGRPPSRMVTTRAYRKEYNSHRVFNSARRNNPATYYERRTAYYGAGYVTPSYAYGFAPAYGPWDSLYLASSLSNIHTASLFAHHHQHDPAYRRWRAEAETQAMENAELRAKLDAVDAAKVAHADLAINDGYLPEGVDADIALSSAARTSALPDFRVCTGSETGAYFLLTTGVIAPNAEYVNPVPVITAGTGQTLEYIASGKCDAGWAQANGYWNYIEEYQTANLPFTRLFSPYKEAVHLICHENGPSKISQIDSDNKIWFPKGSGAEVTFLDWISEDDHYADIKTILNTPSMVEVKTNEEALLKVSNDPKSCMMYVAAPGATEFMKNANASAKTMKTVMIDINDGDLDDTTDPSGEDVYHKTQVDSSIYSNLTRQAGSLYGSGDIHTFNVNADFLVSDAWKKKNPTIYGKVAMKIAGMGDRINLVLKP